MLANELDNVTNANMQFDEYSLEPLYKLNIGQAGSSFTFEVAQKNKIPFSLINKAKKRVEKGKVRLDKTISKLQRERTAFQKKSEGLAKQKIKEQERINKLEDKEDKIQAKLLGFQELYNNNQKMLTFGRKINEFLNKYFQNNNKKELNSSFTKWVESEKVKYVKKNPLKSKSKLQKKQAKINERIMNDEIKKVENEVLKKVKQVRKIKKKEAEKIVIERANYIFKVNDKVRLIEGDTIGTIEKIEKKKAFINYGLFTTTASFDKLEIVKNQS